MKRRVAFFVTFGTFMLCVGLVIFLLTQDLDRADKWASVLALFVGLVGLAVSARVALGADKPTIKEPLQASDDPIATHHCEGTNVENAIQVMKAEKLRIGKIRINNRF